MRAAHCQRAHLTRRNPRDITRTGQITRAAILGGNLYRAFHHLHRGACGINRNAESGALHHRRQIGRLDDKVRVGLFVNTEYGVAEFFDQLAPAARSSARGLGYLQPGLRRDHRIFLAPYQHRARIGGGGYDVPRNQMAIAQPGKAVPGVQHGNARRGFGNGPARRFGQRGRGKPAASTAASGDQKQNLAAHRQFLGHRRATAAHPLHYREVVNHMLKKSG